MFFSILFEVSYSISSLMKFPFFGRCHVVAACFFVTCVVVFCCHAQDSQSYDEWSLLEFGERTGTSEALPLGDFNGKWRGRE